MRPSQSTWGALLLLATLSGSGCNSSTITPATSAALLQKSLTFSDATSNSLTLHWTAADSLLAVGTLKYLAFYIETDPGSTDQTAATIKAEWTAVGTAAPGITSVSIPNLTAETKYYFTVLATDSANNITVYPVASQTTLAADSTDTITTTTDTTDTTDTTPPTPGASGTLVFTGATTSGLTVEWTAATDAVSSASTLVYKVYYSTTAGDVATLDSMTDADSDAVYAGSVTGGGSLALTGLASDTTYYMNIVVSDEAANAAAYTAGSSATAITLDSAAPTVSSGTLTASSITTTGLTLSWVGATDDVTPASALHYMVIYQDMDTAPPAVSIDAGNNTSLNITGLTPATTYIFQVVVRDEVGNNTTYTPKTQRTSSP